MTFDLVFVYGFVGAFAVDFQAFFEKVNEATPQLAGTINEQSSLRYWWLWLVHAFVGGSLAVAYAQTYSDANALVLMAIGGSSRILILKFGQLVAEIKMK